MYYNSRPNTPVKYYNRCQTPPFQMFIRICCLNEVQRSTCRLCLHLSNIERFCIYQPTFQIHSSDCCLDFRPQH